MHECGKRIKSKSPKVSGANLYVCRSYRRKTGRGPFCPPPPVLNKLITLNMKFFWCKNHGRSPWRCCVKKDVLKNFTNFTGKHLYLSLFLITLQVFCCETCDILRTSFLNNISEGLPTILLALEVSSVALCSYSFC